jgi:hypothetical protein
MLNSATRYIHPTLEIPAEIQSEVFPDVSLSVLDFLQFPLPIVSGTATRHKPSDFFSKDQPNTQNIKAIQKIPDPPAKTVAELVVFVQDSCPVRNTLAEMSACALCICREIPGVDYSLLGRGSGVADNIS